MEELQLKQMDLVGEIGGKSRVSEILNRKRKLTVETILNYQKPSKAFRFKNHIVVIH